ncbi:interferon-inducible GTPase 1-like isoform X2 [Mya arenaria]|uniref:interferon-inducible GTPase 1-like isoform X2 n=1 Tax=Mya arenaria TaxID=6604 RepID=UPI0022E66878|nr:interferon-inducible GTPase 1-like isoform X2 [Mya arenaria]
MDLCSYQNCVGKNNESNMFEWIQLTLTIGMIGLVLFVWLRKNNDVKEAPRPAQKSFMTQDVQTDNTGQNQAVTKAVQTDNEANAVVNGSDEDLMETFVDLKMTEDLQKEYETTLLTGGISALQKKISSELNVWQNIVTRFAIIGESGSGKSSFINAMLELTGDDPTAAKVGCNECTTECKEFRHPRKKTLSFTDLPGVGTPNFPKETYLEAVQFESFHFFILITQCRFKENDLWLVKEITKREKHFYFVRTKIDVDVSSDKKAHPRSHNRVKLLKEIRTKTAEQLKSINVSPDNVFLIDNYETRQFDFQTMMTRLIVDAPSLNKQSLIFSISAAGANILKEKVASLRSRIKYQAMLASIGSLAPIPGVGLACEVGILMKEVNFYKSQLGTDKNTMQQLAMKMDMPVDSLYKQLGMTSHILLASRDSFLKLCTEIAVSEATESLLKWTAPIFGHLVSAAASFPVCSYTLNRLLNMCEEEAIKVNKEFENWIVEKTSSSVDPSTWLTNPSTCS